jgi:hypothetical protein
MSGRRLWLLAALFVPYAVLIGAISSLWWVVLAEGPVAGAADWARGVGSAAKEFGQPGWVLLAYLPGGLIALTQFLFLVPLVDVRVSVRREGRPWVVAMIGAACVAAAATTALLLAVFDLVWLIGFGEGREFKEELRLVEVILGTLLCTWVIWTPLLVVFSRKWPHRTMPGRLVGMLLGGTILELLVVLPVDIVVRNRNSCYCATASYHATWIAGLVLLWLTGPGVFIALTSRRRRAWLESHCHHCGYRKGPSPGPRCPECGRAWLRAGAKKKGDRRDSNP